MCLCHIITASCIGRTGDKWGRDSLVWPSVNTWAQFPVSPCLKRTQSLYCASQEQSCWVHQWPADCPNQEEPLTLKGYWCVHPAYSIHTLIPLRLMLEYTKADTRTFTSAEAAQGEMSWPVAWQEPSRWKILVRSISNSEQMIRLVLKLQSGWQHQMQTVFWQRKSFWCLSLKHKSQRRRAEINTTVVIAMLRVVVLITVQMRCKISPIRLSSQHT